MFHKPEPIGFFDRTLIIKKIRKQQKTQYYPIFNYDYTMRFVKTVRCANVSGAF